MPKFSGGITPLSEIEKMPHSAGTYRDQGDHYINVVCGETERCVACDQPIEYAKHVVDGVDCVGGANHHCKPEAENRRQGRSRGEQELRGDRDRGAYSLSDGFAMLGEGYDDE